MQLIAWFLRQWYDGLRVLNRALESIYLSGQNHGLLTAAQEYALAQQIQRWQQWPGGADEAPEHIQRIGLKCRDSLVSNNRRLVLSMLRRYNVRSFDRDMEVADLFQLGLMGLTNAAEKFDPSRGFRFSTIAVFWIRQSINRGLHNNRGLVRVPVHLSEKITKVKRFVLNYTTENKEAPTLDIISKSTDISKEEISRLMNIHTLQQHSSVESIGPSSTNLNREDLDHFLDAYSPRQDSIILATNDQNNTINAIIDEEENNQIVLRIKHLLKILTAEQRFVVIHYYGLFDHDAIKFDQIAIKMNEDFTTDQYDRAKIRSLHYSAIRKLSNYAKPAKLERQDSEALVC